MRRNDGGFTLVEALIGLVLAVLVVGGLVGLMGSAARLFRGAQDRLDPREGAYLALSQVGLQLMDAWAFEVSETGESVRYRTAQGDGELAFDAKEKRVTLRASGASRIIASGVKRFATREIFTGMLRMELELARVRVVHEVRVPTLGDRNPLLPLRPVFAPADA